MEVGRSYLVKVFLDDKNRIVATTKIDRFISEENTDFKVGQKVSLMITDQTELGFKAIIENTHWGLLYQNELFQTLKRGQRLDGYIKKIRDDYKIDLSLHKPIYNEFDSLNETILSKLKDNNGVLALSDKSPPELIYATFGVSKKAFKQAIGTLYKNKLISLDKSELRLL